VEFGLIPLQSITNKMILENFKKRRSIYDLEGYIKLKIRRNIHNNENDKNSPAKNNKKEKEDKIQQFIPESYYWNKLLKISFDFNKFGKLKIFENFICIKEVVDHSKQIIDVFFNKRLNIFATTSFDGLICVYILPFKLISTIKHPEAKFFYDKVYVSANPFPTIVAYEKKNNLLRSYSISGLLIKEKKIILEDETKNENKKENNNGIDENKDKKTKKGKKNKKETKEKENQGKENQEKGLYIINPLFDFYGGNFKDRIIVYNKEIVIEYSIPFFKEIRSSFFTNKK